MLRQLASVFITQTHIINNVHRICKDPQKKCLNRELGTLSQIYKTLIKHCYSKHQCIIHYVYSKLIFSSNSIFTCSIIVFTPSHI